MVHAPAVSIILPVRNESRVIAANLRHLMSLGADEVVAVDGASDDGTDEIISGEFPEVCLLSTGRAHRAFQMNQGAARARSEILLFVAADMMLPQDAVGRIKRRCSEGYDYGGFIKTYSPAGLILNTYGYLLNEIYLKKMRQMVGTNAIFATRQLFEKAGGFPEVDFLEDLIFSQQARKCGKSTVIESPVTISSRRYLQKGTLRQMLINARVMIGHCWLKEPASRLREMYNR